MSEWLCLTDDLVMGFTKGKYYSVDEDGDLIDDDGCHRLSPDDYGDKCFKEMSLDLENV